MKSKNEETIRKYKKLKMDEETRRRIEMNREAAKLYEQNLLSQKKSDDGNNYVKRTLSHSRCLKIIYNNLLTIIIEENSYSEALKHFKEEVISRLDFFISSHRGMFEKIQFGMPIKNIFVSYLIMIFKIWWDQLATSSDVTEFNAIGVFEKARAFASNYVEFKDCFSGNKCYCNYQDVEYLNDWKSSLNKLDPGRVNLEYERAARLVTEILDFSCSELAVALAIIKIDDNHIINTKYEGCLKSYQKRLEEILSTDKWYINNCASEGRTNYDIFKLYLKTWNLHNIYEHVNKHVYKQDDAKRSLSTVFYNHIQRLANPDEKITKRNALIIGPSGCGKTELFRSLEEISPVHMFKIDMSTIAPESWSGHWLSQVFESEKQRLAHDQLIEESIVFLDEFDKIFKEDTSVGNSAAYQQDLIANLLGLLEDGVVLDNNGKKICNCDKCTFVLAGAFENLLVDDNIVVSSENRQKNTKKISRKVINQKLFEFGLTKEILGRIGNVQRIYPLSVKDFIYILKNMPSSAVFSIQTEFKLLGVKLKIEESAYRAAAEYAVESKLGVRGANAILHQASDDLKFEVMQKDLKTATITGKRLEKYLEA